MVNMSWLLLFAGADVNVRNNYGETALIAALWRPNNIENVSLLINNGADASIVTNYGCPHVSKIVAKAVVIELPCVLWTGNVKLARDSPVLFCIPLFSM